MTPASQLISAIFLALLLATMPPRGHSFREATHLHDLAVAIVTHHGQEDPWVLAALSVKETRARVHVVGRLGECGAMQVMGWHLRPRMTCADLQTAEGSVVGAVRAIGQWRAWAPADVDPWACYAAGYGCLDGHGARATRRLFDLRGELVATQETEHDSSIVPNLP